MYHHQSGKKDTRHEKTIVLAEEVQSTLHLDSIVTTQRWRLTSTSSVRLEDRCRNMTPLLVVVNTTRYSLVSMYISRGTVSSIIRMYVSLNMFRVRDEASVTNIQLEVFQVENID